MNEIVENFKISLIEDGKSPKTIESYVGDIKAFKEFLGSKGVRISELCIIKIRNIDSRFRGLDPNNLDEIEVKFNYKSKYNEAEFARQLADQEAGMNKLTVDEYLKNRERYIAEGRAIEGNAAQQAARKEALAIKVGELLDSGISFQEAEKQAEKWLDSQAALHNPDQISGGNPLNIGGMGDKKINSSIGSQWKYRIDEVDEQIRKLADKMTDKEKESIYLNIKLKY